MKTVITAGERTIVLVSEDLDMEFLLEDITKIDYSNLYGEAVTIAALLNRVGMIRADAEADLSEAKLSCDIYESDLRRRLRREAVMNGGRVKVNDESIKLTENSLNEVVILDLGYQMKKREVITAQKNYSYVDNLFWAVNAKNGKLNNLLPKVTPQEFVNELVADKVVNTFLIKKL
jgi:hypothetical protein